MERTTTDAVIERPQTLIEKLENEVNQLRKLRAQEKPRSLGYMFLGHHIVATVHAINIVKQHSDWVSFNNQLPKNLQRILVCFKEKGIISGTWYTDSKNPNDGFFSSDNGLSDFYRLSDNTMDLWQPLPEPPQLHEFI